MLRVCVQRLNGIPNAPSASGPTPTQVPEFETFRHAVQLLRDLQLADALSAGYVHEADTSKPTVQIAESFRDTPKLHELTELLGLARGLRSYRLTTDLGKAAPDAIGIGTRSLLGVMFYLSQSVEVPPEDEVAGKVTVTRFASGEAFDWRAVTGGILRVRSSSTSPGNAAVSIRYRNHWFYIDDADLDSKSSFTLLSQLFALQSGRSRGLSPVLTLPVGR